MHAQQIRSCATTMQQRRVDKSGDPLGDAGAPKSHKTPVKDSVRPKSTEPDAPGNFQAVPLGRTNDEDLMRRTQQGEKQAFELLYERYSASVLSYLYRMLGSIEDVESIGQEVFLRAFRFAPTYRYPQKFSTWLFTITRNLAINSSRRRKRSPIRNITELNLEGVELSGDPHRVAMRATDDVEKQEDIVRVLSALDTLPTDQKEVIVLGIFQDLSYAQMEQITGTKAVTLRSRMFHGLKKLAGMMGGNGRTGKTELGAGGETSP
jgi:RNA polymerase sigma-70 factor (ECF subfamily)